MKVKVLLIMGRGLNRKTEMLIRVISDVHGNLAALKAVLAHHPGEAADETVCLGDTVGYGSHPCACINIVRRVSGITVAGNHDLGAAGLMSISSFNHDGQRAIEWTRTQLETEHLEWLNGLPLQAFPDGLSLTHASPVNPSSWTYIMTASHAIEAVNASEDSLPIYGHTHIAMQWNRFGDCSAAESGSFDECAIINCGSVGQPRDGDPRAAYLLIDTGKRTFEHVRVEYDIEAAAEAIRAAGLPEYLAGRLFLGK